MNKKVKVVLNRSGVRSLLKSQAMMNECVKHARNVLEMCGDGYSMDTMVGKNRVNAMVYADSHEAIKDNSENNTLLKAVSR